MGRAAGPSPAEPPAAGSPAAVGRAGERPAALLAPEVHTVTDTEAVIFVGAEAHHETGLRPARRYRRHGVTFRTLASPPGERLATVATVNDVHFGERECGRIEGHDVGPVLSSEPGEDPYPQVMNTAAAAEIAASDPDLLVAKGDLTSTGTAEEYAEFERCYRPVFDGRLVATRGNHDRPGGAEPAFEVEPVVVRRLRGVTVAVLDTARAGQAGGHLDPDQLDALDELATGSTPVLVFGHHPVLDPSDPQGMGEAGALDSESSAALVALVARRPAVAGYFAGHTHRNRVRRFAATGPVPFAEVAATKDYPGSWAEYRVHEGGILALHHRIGAPGALAWSERCRAMIFGLYADFALGSVEDRCYLIGLRRA